MIKKPVTKIGGATRRRAMQRVVAFFPLNLDLPPVDGSPADRADPLVVERIPKTIIVRRLQYFQPIRSGQVPIHKSLLNDKFLPPAISRKERVSLGKRLRQL